MVNEKANVHVTLNSKEAQNQLEELQGEMKRLIALKKKAEEEGDVKGYKKIDSQLKKVNRSANKLVNEHRDLERTLKDINGASINELRTAQRTLTAQTSKLNRKTKEYTDKRKQLALVKNEISKINSEYRKQKGFVSRVTDGFNKYFSVITAGAATFAGLVLGMRKAVDTYNDFEERLSNLSALTGLTGDSLQWLGKQAQDLSQKTFENGIRITQSSADIVDAYTKMGSARPELLKNKEALAQVTENALILAEAAKMEAEPAIAAVAAAMNQFDLAADQSTRIINTFAAGSLAGSAEVDDLTESFANVGTVADDSNLTLEQTVGLLEVLAEKQLKGAEAGTMLRSSLLKMKAAQLGYQSGTFNLKDALVEANEKLNSFSTDLEKDAYKQEIFGQRSIVVGTILLNNTEKFDQLTTAVTGTNVALDQAATNTDNNAAKLKQAKNRINIVTQELGEKLAPAMTHVVSKGSLILKFLSGAVDFFTKYGKIILSTTAAIVAYTIAIQVVAKWDNIHYGFLLAKNFATKAYALTTGVLTGKIKLATVAQKAWNLAQKANPIGLIAGLVAGAAVTITAYIRKTKKAKETQKDFNDELENTEDLLGGKMYQQFLEEIGLFKEEMIRMADGSVKFIKVFDDSVNILDKFGSKVKSLKENDLQNFKQFFENEIVDLQRSLQNLDPESILYLTNKSKILEYTDALGLVQQELDKIAEARKKLNENSGTSPIYSEEQAKKDLAQLQITLNEEKTILTEERTLGAIKEREFKDKMIGIEMAYLLAKKKILKKSGEDTSAIDLEIANKHLKIVDDRIKEEVRLEKEGRKILKTLPEEEDVTESPETTYRLQQFMKTLEFEELMVNQQYEKGIIGKTEYEDRLTEIERKKSADRKKIQDKYSKAVIDTAYHVTNAVFALQDMELAKAEGDSEKQKEIKKKYADVAFAISAAEIITSTVSAAMNAYDAMANIPYVGPALGAVAAAAIAVVGAAQLSTANTERQKVKALAKGKYPVEADDGRTYNATWTGKPHTGMYDGPQLGIFNEVPGQPEMVVDGITTKNLQVNYPEIVEAIYNVRDGKTPKFAEGKYPQQTFDPADKQSTSSNGELKYLIEQNTQAMQAMLDMKIYTSIEDIENGRKRFLKIQETRGL